MFFLYTFEKLFPELSFFWLSDYNSTKTTQLSIFIDFFELSTDKISESRPDNVSLCDSSHVRDDGNVHEEPAVS